MIEVRGNHVYDVMQLGATKIEQLIDDRYHIRLEAIDGEVKARVFDYLGEKQLIKRTIKFVVDDGDPVSVDTVNGVATITAAAGTVAASTPNVRGAAIELG